MRRARLVIAVAVLVVLAVIAVAVGRTGGHSSVAAHTTPVEAGAPAAIALDTTFDPATTGELTAVELDLARGFHFDPRAAEVCTDAQAHAGECPRPTTIGRGRGQIVVTGHYLPRTTYDVGATLYLARPRHPGDLAGVVLDLYETESRLHATMFGRVAALPHGPYGLALRFSNTDTELPSHYRLTLLKLSTLLAAHRTVGATTYNLLTNPTACTGAGWPVQLLIESNHRPQVYDSNASCSS
jgi:hypothetical protein